MSNQVQTLNAHDNSKVHVGDSYTTNNYQATEKSEQEAINECLNSLRVTDPREDKTRIQQTKGGLLKGSYHWALETDEFKKWRNTTECRILWVKGDPGKGKTMLLCGMIDELTASSKLTDTKRDVSLSYFFCQATNAELNNATAVLCGLVYLLAVQNPSITTHIRERYHGSSAIGTGHRNSRITMENILSHILEDPAIKSSFLIIDALDECEGELDALLHFIKSHASKIKWIISSRNNPDIERALSSDRMKLPLSLELNKQSVDQAIHAYIQYQIEKLAKERRCEEKVLISVHDHLINNAHGTFLWVSLVCQELERCPNWELEHQVKSFPPGLDKLYETMIDQIKRPRSLDLCKKTLASVLVAYRPLRIKELARLQDFTADEKDIPEMIKSCGSFLVTQGDTVVLVHQSAKDFLLQFWKLELFPDGIEIKHRDMFKTCLDLMHDLKKDMYNLRHPGIHIDQVPSLRPKSDILAYLAYPCLHWVDHLRDAGETAQATVIQRGGKLYLFLSQRSLFWIEALIHLRSLSKGILMLRALQELLKPFVKQGHISESTKIIYDAEQFILHFREGIEEHPLQIYASALLFSPRLSLIRHHFQKEMIGGIDGNPKLNDTWNTRLRTFECDISATRLLSFSPTGDRLAALVKLYDALSLRIWHLNDLSMKIIPTPGNELRNVALSSDWRWYGVVSPDVGIAVWSFNIMSSPALCCKWVEPNVPAGFIVKLAFSPDSEWLAILSVKELCVWAIEARATWNFALGKGLNRWVSGVIFSSDSELVAAFSSYAIIVLDASSGEEKGYREISEENGINPRFIPETHSLVVERDSGLVIWDINEETADIWIPNPFNLGQNLVHLVDDHWGPRCDEACWDARAWSYFCELQSEQGSSYFPTMLSPDGEWLAGNNVQGMWLWRTVGELMELPQVYDDNEQKKITKKKAFNTRFRQKLFQHFHRKKDQVKILDTLHQHETPRDITIDGIYLSDDARTLVVRLWNGPLEIWDAQRNKPLAKVKEATTQGFQLSADGQLLVARLNLEGTSIVGIFDAATGGLRRKIQIDSSVTFTTISQGYDQTGQQVVIVSGESQLSFFRANTGALQMKRDIEWFFGTGVKRLDAVRMDVAFSSIKNLVAATSVIDKTLHLRIRNTATGDTDTFTSPQTKAGLFNSLSQACFSPSGDWLVVRCLCQGDGPDHIYLWDVQSKHLRGQCYANIDEMRWVDESAIQTNLGLLHFNLIESLSNPLDDTNKEANVNEVGGFTEAGISDNCSWITWDGQPILWLPTEHRCLWHLKALVHRNVVTFGTDSGGIFSIRLDPLLLRQMQK